MLGKVSAGRHGAAVAAIVGTTAFTGLGWIGQSDLPERFEQWQTVISPEGANGVRIDEVIDQDFGTEERRGHLTYIDHSFGAPVDIVASSLDAPDRLWVDPFSDSTEVRIGDPDVTISGQHRYTLGYTLPDAHLDTGVLSLDVLEPDGEQIDRFELVVTGLVLARPTCLVGVEGATTTCRFVEQRTGFYRAVAEPVRAGEGVTFEADITGRVDPERVREPALPDRRQSRRAPLTLAVGALGAGAAGLAYWRARRRGSNEVYGPGATDAAFGAPPSSRLGSDDAPPSVGVVTDDELGDLATIEFEPPREIAPWEARVLLTEVIGDDTVEAWLSGLAGEEAIVLSERNSAMVIESGQMRTNLPLDDTRLLRGILDVRDPYVTGNYDKKFAAAWEAVRQHQIERIGVSGWWLRRTPGAGGRGVLAGSRWQPVGYLALAAFWVGLPAGLLFGWFRSWPAALVVGVALPAVVGFLVYRSMLPSLSAQGSALALRAESFRRFLHASEGGHVEWAWSKGLLREYSGWAVALGEADAWSNALSRANVPEPAQVAAGPLIVHRRNSSIYRTKQPPSSSGGGSSRRRSSRSRSSFRSGVRSGRVGGGGGGRSRGSW